VNLIECVPNFSEGRRAVIVDEIVAAIAGVPGVHLLDRQSDAAHNRSVVTFAAPSEAAAEAALAGIAAASRLIDLNSHHGAHPRFGAADVVPFVPLQDGDMPLCVAVAETVARRAAAELGIPAYLYEQAARRPERRDLADVRRGGFEGLRESIATDPRRAPDFGAAELHPTAGAVAVGARRPLIAYNVNLRSEDVELARGIAGEIRERDGGLAHVKAIGLALEDCVQVSMNLTDYRVTSMSAAFEAVRSRAAARGVQVRESEIVGLVPQEALVDVAGAALLAGGLSRDQVLEARVLDALL
jgi:glutamate formiminotransferase